jgi:hypothetical protein
MECPLVALGLLAVITLGCHVQAPQAPSEVIPFRLGQSEIAFVVHATDRAHPTFLVLHDDENTAVDAGLETIRARGGRLVEVQAQGDRLVDFELDGARWRFDPNRIFTEAGAAATLREHNGAATANVLAEVRRFADAVLAAYDVASPRPLITLHNNTEGEYSALSYLPGGGHARDAAAVHLPPEVSPDDFFFVTDRRLFDGLAREGFPVVLQDNTRMTDDGSLSVWAGHRGVPYVNVETKHGHRERQIEMLEALARVLAGLHEPVPAR